MNKSMSRQKFKKTFDAIDEFKSQKDNITDTLGSYTGCPDCSDEPTQDADDL